MKSFSEAIKKKGVKTLYISRPVKNARDIISWAASQGFKTTLQPKDMHVTVAFSSKKVDWNDIKAEQTPIVIKGGKRIVKPLGDKGAVVLTFESPELQKRWKNILSFGASWDYPEYHPHISITYDGSGVDVSKMEPYTGQIILDSEDRHELVDDFEESVKEIKPKTIDSQRKFFVLSSFGELLDVAMRLQDEGEDVVLYVPDKDYKTIGDGIVPKATNWHEYLGKGYIFVVDGCENAGLQDWLRSQGEAVVGTNEVMTEYEEDRQKGQELFKKCGFKQPDSENFTDFDEAIDFIEENEGTRFILKQNGDAPKSLNHMSKFDDGSDMIYHLEELKNTWKESTNGPVDFDLMEIVEGVEIAASAFFNGHDWLRDKEGKVVGFLNVEHKKQLDGNLGETTGEMGTLFIGADESNEHFRTMILQPEVEKLLKKSDYRGVFDINGSMTKDGFVAFEPTSRFGVPATSYEFMQGLEMKTGDLLEAMAKGLDTPISIYKGIGMVTVVVSKPFPVEADMDDTATSMGQKLWILKDKSPLDDFTDEQRKHICLENFMKDDEGNYKVATKSGYLLTVTMRGKDIEEAREKSKDYIKENIYIAGMGYRQDLGKSFEEHVSRFMAK